MAALQCLPFDVVMLVVQEHLNQGGSLLTVYKLSRTFLLACRLKVFRSIKISIMDTDDLIALFCILYTNPDIRSAVKCIEISDDIHKSRSAECMRKLTSTERYSEATNEFSVLSAILRLLSPNDLQEVSLMLTYSHYFQQCFRWDDLSRSLQHLLLKKGLSKVSLGGIRCISSSLSASLLSVEEVSIRGCTFSLFHPASFNNKVPTFSPSLKSLTFEWTSLRQDVTIAETNILECWIFMRFIVPQIFELTLLPVDTRSINEAAVFVKAFGPTATKLNISTTGLQLPLQPFLSQNPSVYQSNLRHMDHPSSRSLHTPAMINLFGEGWAARVLDPLTSSLTDAVNYSYRSLRFGVTYWERHDPDDYNGELEWIANLLQDLPPAYAQRVQDIRLDISIPLSSYGYPQPQLAYVLVNLAHDYTWAILNEALRGIRWSKMKMLHIRLHIDAILSAGESRANGEFCASVAQFIQNEYLFELRQTGCQFKVDFIGLENAAL